MAFSGLIQDMKHSFFTQSIIVILLLWGHFHLTAQQFIWSNEGSGNKYNGGNAVASADMDGDGLPDIISFHEGVELIIQYNRPQTCHRTDTLWNGHQHLSLVNGRRRYRWKWLAGYRYYRIQPISLHVSNNGWTVGPIGLSGRWVEASRL